jgi:hypothetical protein
MLLGSEPPYLYYSVCALRSLHFFFLMPGPSKESDLTSTALRAAFQLPPPTCATHRREEYKEAGGGGHGLGGGV